MSKLKWGILGTSKFAREKIIPALKKSQYCEVSAISSRDLNKSSEYAEQLQIPKAYGSYEEMLGDPDLDVIYNPLPNHGHVDWSIEALDAGKHVLCEKPLGLSADDAQRLLDASRTKPHLKVMEAFMYRHHPQWQKAKAIVSSGGIGELRMIQSFFSYYNADPKNVRNQAGIGGGGLMDIGCYCVSLSRFIFDAEPRRVCGWMEIDETFETDRLASGMMEFENGVASFTCATQLNTYQRVNIHGTDGRVEIEIPFNAPPDKPCKLWHQRGEEIDEIVFDVCDQYTIQGDLFSQAIMNDTPVPTLLEDAVNNMKAIDAIRESAEKGEWVRIV